jgi:hypothetical protein
MKKSVVGLVVLSFLTLLAVTANAQGSQAPERPTPVSAEAGAAASPAPAPSGASDHPELFPMPVIPPEADTRAQPTPSRGAELFPTPVVPADAGTAAMRAASSAASSRKEELFPTLSIPDEDIPSPPAPLTQAELELQALIQNAIVKDPTLSGGDVNVAMSADGIELTGTVASMRARLAASRLAKSYAAGRKVLDKITVATNPETPTERAPVKADSSGTTHQHP